MSRLPGGSISQLVIARGVLVFASTNGRIYVGSVIRLGESITGSALNAPLTSWLWRW
jgi:hypothetical protein